MAQKFPSHWKKCATCVYWTGPREVDYMGMWVSTASNETKGRCMCRAGFYRVERAAWLDCPKHEKWPALS